MATYAKKKGRETLPSEHPATSYDAVPPGEIPAASDGGPSSSRESTVTLNPSDSSMQGLQEEPVIVIHDDELSE